MWMTTPVNFSQPTYLSSSAKSDQNGYAMTIRIAVVAPGSPITRSNAAGVLECAAAHENVQVTIDSQCHLADGHFAGSDEVRAEAFVHAANDPSNQAVWFAHGGYGACRILDLALPRLSPEAKTKTYMGYSDAGSLLGALYKVGFTNVAHGPMPRDWLRPDGRDAIHRAIRWMVNKSEAEIEPGAIAAKADGYPTAAFNITILSHLLGTAWEPDLTGHVLFLEEVSEPTYRTDRALFHITSCLKGKGLVGLRLGRCLSIPENSPHFGKCETRLAQEWCERSGIAWLGTADIGHDAWNMIVPFGLR